MKREPLTTLGLLLLSLPTVACTSADVEEVGGPANTPRIVGGAATPAHDFRFMASLRNAADVDYCEASLIAPTWLLTSARCLCHPPGLLTTAVVGGIDPNNPSDGDRRAIKRIIRHESYDCEGLARQPFDIGLVELEYATSKVPVVINDDDAFPDAVAWGQAAATDVNAVAVGAWSAGQPGPQTQQAVDLPVVTNASCANTQVIQPAHVCAGIAGDPAGLCFSDRGGPLLSYDHSAPLQIGIASFSNHGCDNSAAPSVFTRVSQFTSWIRGFGVPFIARSDLEPSGDPARMVGLGGLSNAVRHRHLFARDNDTLAHYQWSANAWAKDLASDNAGVTDWVLGDVAALESPVREDFGVPRYNVAARRDDGALVVMEMSELDVWSAEDVTADAQVLSPVDELPIDGDPHLIRGSRDAQGEETIHVFAPGEGVDQSPGGIIHYFRAWETPTAPDRTWFAEDLSFETSASADLRAADRLAVLNSAGMDDPGGRSQHVFFRGLQSNLGHYYWSAQQGWAAEDLTERGYDRRAEEDMPFHNLDLASDPVALNGDSAHNHGVRSMHLFALSTTSHPVHHFWTNSDSWRGEDLAELVPPGRQCDISERPFALNGTSRGNNGVRDQHVFARNGTGELIHYFWINYLGWDCENLSETVDAEHGKYFALDSRPYALIGTTVSNEGSQDLAVFARSGDHLIQFGWHRHLGWNAWDLTTEAAAPPNISMVDPIVMLQGPDKGNHGIESFSGYAKGAGTDPYGLDWLNYRGWDHFLVP